MGCSSFQTIIKLRPRFASFSVGVKTIDDKIEVEEYFNNEGFNRWNKIYSNSDEVNSVQRDIRNGHQETIDKVLSWMRDEDNSQKTLCDAGCGVGSLAIPLASKFKKGFTKYKIDIYTLSQLTLSYLLVFASDISAAMTKEASERAKNQEIKNIDFEVKDMEVLSGKYNTVTCIDVMIHYPNNKVN